MRKHGAAPGRQVVFQGADLLSSVREQRSTEIPPRASRRTNPSVSNWRTSPHQRHIPLAHEDPDRPLRLVTAGEPAAVVEAPEEPPPKPIIFGGSRLHNDRRERRGHRAARRREPGPLPKPGPLPTSPHLPLRVHRARSCDPGHGGYGSRDYARRLVLSARAARSARTRVALTVPARPPSQALPRTPTMSAPRPLCAPRSAGTRAPATRS